MSKFELISLHTVLRMLLRGAVLAWCFICNGCARGPMCCKGRYLILEKCLLCLEGMQCFALSSYKKQDFLLNHRALSAIYVSNYTVVKYSRESSQLLVSG